MKVIDINSENVRECVRNRGCEGACECVYTYFLYTCNVCVYLINVMVGMYLRRRKMLY